MYNIYIPKYNDFNSPERLADERRYFSKNKGKTYQDYLNNLASLTGDLNVLMKSHPSAISGQFNDLKCTRIIVEYSLGELGVFYNE